MKFDGILFDFDGVIIESEYEGNAHIADYLSRIGHATSVEHAMTHFMGLSGRQFVDAIEGWIGRPLPQDFYAERAAEDARAMRDGVGPVDGAIDFVRSLPADLPIAIASSSSHAWIRRHLDHNGLLDRFDGLIFSGKEDVPPGRGKPEPDLYLNAARAIGLDIRRAVILEDSPVGVTGALRTGATVIGVTAATHCVNGHADRLRALGVEHIAADYGQVRDLLGLPPA
jgi:HAD superfamily hydrolase (TIGR01509 family)